jgi:TolB-like protein/Tfp pilus assembly protein PilF
MGVVYRAHDEALRRDVAVKVLPSSFATDPDRLRRFEQEARSAGALNHPNILAIYDFGQHEGSPYLVSELLEGKTLREQMGGRAMPVRKAVDYGIQIARGLSAAHERRIVHRDLKPENIFVTGDGRVKILDFGIAKLLGPEEVRVDEGKTATQSPTEAGVLLGTTGYMSPEQFRGEPVDHRSDLFSLGAVLYEMLSGRRAFGGATPADTMSATLSHDPPSLSALREEIPPDLDRTIRRCLEKGTRERFQTAWDLASDLERLAEIKPTGMRGVPRRWGTVAALGLGLALLLGLAALSDVGGLRTRLLTGGHASPIRSLAVLPLVNFSHNPDQEYFADGMTEQLITTLAQIGALRVISRTSVMRFKGTALSLPEIGRKLGVYAIVEGSVQRSGDRVRITAQLIRAASDEHIWAQTYERDLRDALALQAEVAGAIAREVQAQLTPRQQQKVASTRTVSPRAYELYLRGLDAYRRWDKRSEQAALEFLNQAIREDSTYAPAWATIGLVYLVDPGQFGTHDEDVARARQALDRALALDPGLGLAHAVKGEIEYQQDWNWVAAERDLKRAIELTPSLFEAHHSYSHLLMNMGRVEESLEQSRAALALDPLNTAATLHMGWHYLYAGQFDRAIPEYEATLRLDPSYAAAYAQLAWVYGLTGRFDKATEALNKYRELTGSSNTLAMGAALAAMRGRTDEALKVVSELIDRANREKGRAYDVATIFALLGRKDDAFHWLDRAFKKREESLLELKVDPFLAGLRSDPRYAVLLRRIGVPA